MASSGSLKSTIVRASYLTSFRLLDWVAPRVGAALVERIWFRVPQGMPLLEPTGTAFEVRWLGRTIRGQAWGEGPTVYLVHGWGGNADQMRPFVEPLVSAGFRVVAHDAPSHGRSDPGAHGPGSTDAIEFGQALDAVAARFGPAHAIVAHSLGTLATLLALRDGWFTAQRVVLVAPVAGVPWFTDYFRRLLGFGERTERHTYRRLEERTGYPPHDLTTRGLAATLRDGLSALIVQDRDDRSVGTGLARELAEDWPGAEYVETGGLGHNRILADPGVHGAVTRFLLDGLDLDLEAEAEAEAEAEVEVGLAS